MSLRRRTGSWRGPAAAGSLCAGAVLAVSALAGGAASAAARTAPTPFLAVPLASTSAGTGAPAGAGAAWADVPMGNLSQPLDTFWQLFVLKAGGRWLLVTPPGVADNGGLVASGLDTTSLLVGFEPSGNLAFSPIASSTDSGLSWTPGVIESPLAALPDAIATSGTGSGRAVALSRQAGGTVLVERGSLSSWSRLASRAAIGGAAAGRRCSPVRLTAVALSAAAAPLVGAACDRPGAVGIFSETARGWRLDAPALPRALGGATASVLRLDDRAGTLLALLALAGGDGSSRRISLLLASQPAGSPTWAVSSSLELGAGARLVSTGTTAPTGEVVVWSDGRGGSGEHAAVVAPGSPGSPGTRSSWQSLPTLPAGTTAVSVGAEVHALIARGSLVTDEMLSGVARRAADGWPAGGWHSGRWVLERHIAVPLQYGSSS